jgi:hypothetical protein
LPLLVGEISRQGPFQIPRIHALIQDQRKLIAEQRNRTASAR